MMRQAGLVAIGVATLAAILGAWETLSTLELLNPFFFPPPSRLAAGFHELIVAGYPDGIRIQTHVAVTLRRVLAGFAGSVAIGVPLGIVIGAVPVLDRLTRHIFTFGRSIAAISLLPLFIAWFGIGELSKIMLIGLGSFWVVVSYTVAGVKFVDPILIRAARSIDTPQRRIFSQVILPAALPRIFAGLKVALGVAFMIIVAAEMIATVQGLGALIQEARTSFRTDITMVGMLVIGAIGFALSQLLDWAERRLLPWRSAAEER
jgi:ABC-type nitrate/sulfonate/bicarbonate transport system permease component